MALALKRLALFLVIWRFGGRFGAVVNSCVANAV